MDCRIAGAGQTGIALVDLGKRISLAEVDQVVVSGEPAGHGVRNLVCLWSWFFSLDESADWLGIAEEFFERRAWSHAGAELVLVIASGERVHLTGALEEDFFALVSVGEYRPIETLGYETV